MTKKELECENAVYKYLLEGVQYYFYPGDSGRTLKDIVECLRAFEIIKEKEVNIINFKKWVIGKEWSYNDYLDEITDVNMDGYYFSKIILTKEEFDLLKEVLK